jgi:hypothetical protein
VLLSSRACGGGRDRVGVACNGGAARTVQPAAEVNGGNDAPVVEGGEEEVKELLDSVGKLGVGPIGVLGGPEKGAPRRTESDGGWSSSALVGGQCGALGIQLRGRKAPRGREESTLGVVVVREGSEYVRPGATGLCT